MPNTTDLAPNLNLQSGVSAARKHLREHGGSLCHLLDELDEPLGIDALCDLNNELEIPHPERIIVETALREIERVLARQTPSSLDRLGRERNFFAADATSWHGARVSEFLARISREG